MKTYKMKINSENYEAKILKYTGTTAKVLVNGTEFFVEIEPEAIAGTTKIYRSKREVPSSPELSGGVSDVKAPIPGQILDIKVSLNQKVSKGDILLLLEAMKMESEIQAPYDGTIESISVSKGDSVQEGDLLIKIIHDKNEMAIERNRRSSDAVEPAPTPPKKKVTGKKSVLSPLPGTIMKINVKVGDSIKENDIVLILEAMKMESEISSDFTGKVKEILITQGQSVHEGQELVVFE